MFSYETIFHNQHRFKSYLNDHDFLFKVAAEECMASLTESTLTPNSVLVLGYFPLLDTLKHRYPNATIDTYPQFTPVIPTQTKYDLIISLGQFQWINDPEHYLKTLYSILNPNGFFYGIFPGEDSLKELHSALIKAEMVLTKGAAQRIIPMISASDTLQLIQLAKFSNPLVHVVSIELQHDSIFELINDLRCMGVSNPLMNRSKIFAPKKLFSLADHHLKRKHDCVETTIDLVVMMGQK